MFGMTYSGILSSFHVNIILFGIYIACFRDVNHWFRHVLMIPLGAGRDQCDANKQKPVLGHLFDSVW